MKKNFNVPAKDQVSNVWWRESVSLQMSRRSSWWGEPATLCSPDTSHPHSPPNLSSKNLMKACNNNLLCSRFKEKKTLNFWPSVSVTFQRWQSCKPNLFRRSINPGNDGFLRRVEEEELLHRGRVAQVAKRAVTMGLKKNQLLRYAQQRQLQLHEQTVTIIWPKSTEYGLRHTVYL